MNTRLQRPEDRKLLRFELELADRLEALFHDCPALCGFTVEDKQPVPANVTCLHVSSISEAEKIVGRVADLLLQLIEAEPRAADMLCGRTFARMLH